MLTENHNPHDLPALRGPIRLTGRVDDVFRLWAWRRLRLTGTSTFEWSRQAGLGRAAGHRWLEGHTEPSVSRAMLLMRELGVDLADGLPSLLSDLDGLPSLREREGGDA